MIERRLPRKHSFVITIQLAVLPRVQNIVSGAIRKFVRLKNVFNTPNIALFVKPWIDRVALGGVACYSVEYVLVSHDHKGAELVSL